MDFKDIDYKHNISWKDKTALFGTYLVDKGVQSSTLKSYFSAIKHVLRLDGYKWDDDKMILSSLVRGCKLENDKVKVRLPIQKGLLEMILFEVQRMYSSDSQQPYLEHMYKALFCLAYYGMMRVGELTYSPHVLKASNIHVGNNKEKILIVLYSSKTHGKESRPQRIKISAAPTSNVIRNKRFFCPFKAVLNFMSLRGNYEEDDEQFFIFADKSKVKPHHVRSVLRNLLDRMNLDGQLYDVHSYRIGRTSDLSKFGYSVEQIKAMGRWKSNAVYRYIRQ